MQTPLSDVVKTLTDAEPQPQEAQKRYLHLCFGMLDLERNRVLENIVGNLSEDWLRYTSTSWIVWTKYDQNVWFEALKHCLFKGEHMLILELKGNQGQLQGMVPQWIWDWLNKKR